MPLDFGQLVGQTAFEQARGVVMETYDCSADQAMALIGEACESGRSVDTVVAALRVQHADVLRVIRPESN